MMTVRRAEPNDVRRVFDLSNDSVVRASSFQTEPLVWDNHVSWFERAIRDPELLFYLGFDEGEFVGQVRLKAQSEGLYLLSISLTEPFRARRVGRPFLGLVCQKFLSEGHRGHIIAEVRPENTVSLRFFAGLGSEGEAAEDGRRRFVFDPQTLTPGVET